MNIKVTFQIPPHSPVDADKLPTRTYRTNNLEIVQNTVTEELLALGFTDASVEFERCVLTLDYFLVLREGDTLLVTAKLDPLPSAVERINNRKSNIGISSRSTNFFKPQGGNNEQ